MLERKKRKKKKSISCSFDNAEFPYIVLKNVNYDTIASHFSRNADRVISKAFQLKLWYISFFPFNRSTKPNNIVRMMLPVVVR